MSGFTAVFDACVLYRESLRNLLIRIALGGLYRARWTERIHIEWIGSLARSRPDLDPAAIERTRSLLDAAVPDCLISSYEGLEATLQLPNPDDRTAPASTDLARTSLDNVR